jgi:glycosyltransferase involved in cell wall biosynthesis
VVASTVAEKNMKFSVLLPTRNRLEYLRYAVETVRRQDYDDWEIIISDNFSEDDIGGYVQSLGDARIKYHRTTEFVPVTDNWNNALEKSSGDYVIMLGDDDCLMRGYFTAIHSLIEKYEVPDFIYTSAFQYAYPNVIPEAADGFLQPYGYADFLRSTQEPFLLEHRKALELVRHSMNFRILAGYNMQFSIVSRKFIDSLSGQGKFYQSPFPDYYATNVMFLKAERILICPHPLVTIGITPKSYGFFHNNNREQTGIAFLGSRPDSEISKKLQNVLLPGTNINTGWLFAMETIKANYGAEFDLRVGYQRYRILQILYDYENYYVSGNLSKEDLEEVNRLMHWRERVVSKGLMYPLFALRRMKLSRLSSSLIFRLHARAKKILKQFPDWNAPTINQRFNNILEVFERVDPFSSDTTR